MQRTVRISSVVPGGNESWEGPASRRETSDRSRTRLIGIPSTLPRRFRVRRDAVVGQSCSDRERGVGTSAALTGTTEAGAVPGPTRFCRCLCGVAGTNAGYRPCPSISVIDMVAGADALPAPKRSPVFSLRANSNLPTSPRSLSLLHPPHVSLHQVQGASTHRIKRDQRYVRQSNRAAQTAAHAT